MKPATSFLLSFSLCVVMSSCKLTPPRSSLQEFYASASDVSELVVHRFYFVDGQPNLERVLAYDCPSSALASLGNAGDRSVALQDARSLCRPVLQGMSAEDFAKNLQRLYLVDNKDAALNSQERFALQDALRAISTKPKDIVAPVVEQAIQSSFDAVKSRFVMLFDAASRAETVSLARPSSGANRYARFASSWDMGSLFVTHVPAAEGGIRFIPALRGEGGASCSHVRILASRQTTQAYSIHMAKMKELVAPCRLALRAVADRNNPPVALASTLPSYASDRATQMRQNSELRLWVFLWQGVRNSWPWMSDIERRQLEVALGSEWRRPPEREDALVAHRSEELLYMNHVLVKDLQLASDKQALSIIRPEQELPSSLDPQGLSLSEWGEALEMELWRRAEHVDAALIIPSPVLERGLQIWLKANAYSHAAEACAASKSCYQWRRTWLGRMPNPIPAEGGQLRASANRVGYQKLSVSLRRLLQDNATPFLLPTEGFP